jgi:hypothetical protein
LALDSRVDSFSGFFWTTNMAPAGRNYTPLAVSNSLLPGIDRWLQLHVLHCTSKNHCAAGNAHTGYFARSRPTPVFYIFA